MADLVVYEKPTCTTCRRLFALLAERGIDADRVDYHVTGLTEPEIRDLLAKADLGPRDVLRTREPAYAEHVAGRELSDDELIALMAEHPSSSSVRSSSAASAPCSPGQSSGCSSCCEAGRRLRRRGGLDRHRVRRGRRRGDHDDDVEVDAAGRCERRDDGGRRAPHRRPA